ncbi:hypothetical protein JDV02_003227 [Purpureocillium takamizusanense]|uniref:Uncharacterized protein n=1 Tax=Purpureocillium takamizusanense TaxID=2060973 RepID=A0A9Q8QCH9_9HYPO|nr:uncharacterized protein JDV02_003227 [Purpureocillium takamizusanense]UNI16828.1 hypothetical protein JDV02_003227 [Purpureocillium takamizusanense]
MVVVVLTYAKGYKARVVPASSLESRNLSPLLFFCLISWAVLPSELADRSTSMSILDAGSPSWAPLACRRYSLLHCPSRTGFVRGISVWLSQPSRLEYRTSLE